MKEKGEHTMKILVNGLEKELIAEGINGIEYTNDLLGNYDALHYDSETEKYTMSDEEFEWWENTIKALNEVTELEERLSEEQREEYDAESWPGDLDDEAKSKIAWIKNRIEK